LKRTHDRLAIALKGSNSGIWDWNLQTDEIFFDETFFQMAGYEPNEFTHSYENWKKLVHADDLKETEKRITSYVKGNANEYTAEFRLKTKNNDWRWILGQGEISEYGDGKAVRFTGTNVDITERKQAELALKQNHDALEEKVKERTSDLKEMNTALRVLLKKRDADEKNIEEQILSNVSSLIIPYIKKLAKTNMDYEQQTFLKIVEANVAEIISPISNRFASSSFGLTLTEIKVANMIKEGIKTKETARILNLSPRTIDKYREKIRTKLSIKNKKVNLQSYLASMQ
jgi:PAS domain S-box-containing protein